MEKDINKILNKNNLYLNNPIIIKDYPIFWIKKFIILLFSKSFYLKTYCFNYNGKLDLII